MKEYHDYWFNIKGFLIGEALALVVCALAGLIVQFVFDGMSPQKGIEYLQSSGCETLMCQRQRSTSRTPIKSS